jgi:hypothetical protein
MDVYTKAAFIRDVDQDIQERLSGARRKQWDILVEKPYQYAKGSGFGLLGIAKEDPDVINTLYDKVTEFLAN